MDTRSKEIVAQVALKEAFNCVHNCPSPVKDGDPFRSPEDVTAEAILVTKTILKGFMEVLTYFDEIDPPAKERPTAPQRSLPKSAPREIADGPVPECPEHGPMEMRSGTKINEETGQEKKWRGWFCSERGCDTKPVWIR